MKHLLTTTVLTLAACAKTPVLEPPVPGAASTDASEAAEADPFDGDWGGTLRMGLAGLRLVLHVRGEAATLDSLDQRVEGIPATSVQRDGEIVTITFAQIGSVFAGRRDGPNLVGEWSQSGAQVPLVLTRDLRPGRTRRPQDPTEPLPYPTESVTIPVEAHQLACTLALPDDTGGPWPGVVLLTGSGPQDRDEAILGHRPFLVLSDHLARNGVASLRCDDRGFGDSTGDFLSATSVDFAVDARGAASWLRLRPEISRVGFIGHSEGGMVAPMAADAADFMVLMAPPAVLGRTLYLRQIEDIAAASGMGDEELLAALDVHAQIIDHVVEGDVLTEALRTGLRARLTRVGMTHPAADAHLDQVFGPWFRYFLDYDPAPSLRAVDLPTLAVWGSTDLQVHAGINEPALREAMASNAKVTTQVFPGLNHLFQPSATGLPSDYAAIDQTLDPAVLDAVSAWILSQD